MLVDFLMYHAWVPGISLICHDELLFLSSVRSELLILSLEQFVSVFINVVSIFFHVCHLCQILALSSVGVVYSDLGDFSIYAQRQLE